MQFPIVFLGGLNFHLNYLFLNLSPLIFYLIDQLGKKLGINEDTLSARIRAGLPEEKWGEVVGGARISTGYTLEEAPKHLREVSEKLAIGLNISTLEAYQLLLEKIDFANL